MKLKAALESPLDCKEIKWVSTKGNQSWIFIERTVEEAEAPILWPPGVKSDSLEKTLMLGKDWRPKEKVGRGWDGLIALLPQCTRLWANSGRQWRTEETGMPQFRKLQSVGQDLATEQQQQQLLSQFSSFQFSRSVVSNSLWLHESQHARPLCPSLTPGVYSNSCPYSWQYHPAISSSVVPFFSYPQSLPASGSFPMSQLFMWGGQNIV